MNASKIIGMMLLSLCGGFIVAIFTMLFVMWIWNYLINPNITQELFGVAKLNLGRAFLLSWLASFLFRTSFTTKD